MPISWNEIRHNAIKFSREWAGVKSESAEKQTFWNEFFQIAEPYDPLTVPPDLLRARANLNRAVEKSYRSEPFHSDLEPVEFLLALYEILTAPLVAMAAQKPKHGKSKSLKERQQKYTHG